jgi:hypothetical protein
MIKLKQLLKEIDQTAVWGVPPEKPEGAPDDVINVLHGIVAVALEHYKGKPIDFDKIFRLHNLSGGHWMVENRVNKDVLLSYNGKNATWYMYGPHTIDIEGVKYGNKLNPIQLNHIIKHWIK